MRIDKNSLYKHLSSRLVELSGVGVALEIRQNKTLPLTLSFGIHEHNLSFPIYRIAKTILAIIALDLSKQGIVDLDVAIEKYSVRDLPEWVMKTTLRELLSHRSGIADYGSLSSYHTAVCLNPSHAEGQDDFVKQVFDLGPQFINGKSFCYSNVGYFLVREIIESQSKMTLQTYFDTKIAKLLKIKMDFLHATSIEISSGFSPYLSTSSPDIRGLYDFSWVFHGTFATSLSNLAILFGNLERLVESNLFKEMIQLYPVHLSHPFISPSYGLGLMGDMKSRFGPLFGHSGGGPGFSVSAYHFPEKEFTIAVMVNRDSTVEAERLMFETVEFLSDVQ